MPAEFKLIRRVEFSETDMAGIVHYSNFFRYMEAAEHAFFRSLGYSVVTTQFDPPLGWPRVHASCDYLQPLRFEEEFEIHLRVCEKRSKALSYTFAFHRIAPPDHPLVARGRVTAVCVTRDATGRMHATTIPHALADLIQVAPEEKS
jgi:YbgC/YbaW family acyl-CoA thioester hydrolase